LVDLAQHTVGQAAATADGAEADVLVEDLPALVEEILFQERHEEIEFRLRALPVLAAQTVERQLADAQPAAFFHRGAHAVGAAGVALDARQTALPRPAAVAVHDDGDVLG